MPVAHVWVGSHTLAPHAVDPTAAHWPLMHCWPVSQQVLPHTTRSAEQQTPLLHVWPFWQTALPHGIEPWATHWLNRQTRLLSQHTPPQISIPVAQQFQPARKPHRAEAAHLEQAHSCRTTRPCATLRSSPTVILTSRQPALHALELACTLVYTMEWCCFFLLLQWGAGPIALML
jgi:hypothetical protein